jgi:hypothetical protein
MWLVPPVSKADTQARSGYRYSSGKSTVHSVLYRRFFGIMQELGRRLSWSRSRMYTSDMS